MANLVEKETYGIRKTILIAPELAFTIPSFISNNGVNENENGRKIIKAGTPLGCDTNFLIERDAELKVDFSNPKAILLHDTDVTDGTVSSSVIIDGYVDLSKLDEDVFEQYNESVVEALPRITFFNKQVGEGGNVFEKLINVPSSINYLRTEHENDPEGTLTEYKFEAFPKDSKPFKIVANFYSWNMGKGCAIDYIYCDTDCILKIARSNGNVWDENDNAELEVYPTEKDYINLTPQIYTIDIIY